VAVPETLVPPIKIPTEYCPFIATGAIQVSDDKTTWYNYGTAITLNNAGTVSEYGWALESAQFRYYRIKLSSSGTGVTTCTGKILLKNK
ncbi:hypothetical protein OEK97_27965, partial [Escherichia coli]|uniref:hypothetical protein n=1 Tax=Escherichia coli TaxID=562 RepID=UPI0021DA97AA